MKRFVNVFLVVLIMGLFGGCAYLQKKDEPPPLPPIEETKPPLTMKSKYFESFPWEDLAKPRKDGNDPDAMAYTVKEGDSWDGIAESMMGSPGLAKGLASYNDMSPGQRVTSGEKIVIPNPIIGLSSQIRVKEKKEKTFGSPKPFSASFNKGDEYKLRFESNVNGYCYVFRLGTKGVDPLFPSKVKIGKRNKTPEPLTRETGKVTAHDALELPIGPKGYLFDPKKQADQIMVFLSLREVPDLEALKDKKTIRPEDVRAFMQRVRESEILAEPPYHLLRITDPKEILGFTLNISG